MTLIDPRFDFDRDIVREGTHALKYDGRAGQFGRADVLPLWVADMDFAVPEAITQALRARAEHPIHGYTRHPASMIEALVGWLARRHGWRIDPEWVVIVPGVVPSLHAATLAFARPGQGVIAQPPVYAPFFSAVTTTGRQLLENPLRLEDGRYRIDFDDLEALAARARLMLLCSPHNPIGRVWTRAELERLLDVARRHRLVVLSDEIHHDLVLPGHRHVPLASLADDVEVITALAPSKTFNIPGLGLSALIAPKPEQRAALRAAFDLLRAGNHNPFSIAAFEAGYREGDAWLDALLGYLAGNRDFALDFATRALPGIRAIPSEGTYLLWLDCRELRAERGWDDAGLRDFFVERAGIGASDGRQFGHGGEGFMRLNLGLPRARLGEALDRLARALKNP